MSKADVIEIEGKVVGKSTPEIRAMCSLTSVNQINN